MERLQSTVGPESPHPWPGSLSWPVPWTGEALSWGKGMFTAASMNLLKEDTQEKREIIKSCSSDTILTSKSTADKTKVLTN